ncbi:unnamed protein product [Onchocerca flexuosa]|uniref:Uncharacterized protein n=1 Tax=Onchocerca flexuosa TaxID=387005 RepID=A0A183I2L1_9BILA|nr:unnamed protein product [Onchocerca flexuosa]
MPGVPMAPKTTSNFLLFVHFNQMGGHLQHTSSSFNISIMKQLIVKERHGTGHGRSTDGDGDGMLRSSRSVMINKVRLISHEARRWRSDKKEEPRKDLKGQNLELELILKSGVFTPTQQ